MKKIARSKNPIQIAVMISRIARHMAFAILSMASNDKYAVINARKIIEGGMCVVFDSHTII